MWNNEDIIEIQNSILKLYQTKFLVKFEIWFQTKTKSYLRFKFHTFSLKVYHSTGINANPMTFSECWGNVKVSFDREYVPK